MSSPSSNSVGFTTYDVDKVPYDGAYLDYTRAVLSGYEWTSNTLTYSFPGGADSGWHISNYGSDGDSSEWLSPGWYTLDDPERAAVKAVLGAYERVADLHFGANPVADNGTTVGDLRYAVAAELSGGDGEYAWAYYPFSDPAAGDVWFSTDWYYNHPGWTTSASSFKGSFDFTTILHETGHALGLKHPFEGDHVLPTDLDCVMFTVMSYDTVGGYPDSGADRYPTTPMYYDIIALEALYGKSMAKPGNDTYTYQASGRYWETLVDGAGTDALVYNSTAGEQTRMSLVPGDYCEFGYAIQYYGAGYTYDYRTVWIGPSTIIEKAVGGPGHEQIIGNAVSNTLKGLGGNDTISGASGADKIDGGAGNDRLSGGAGHDTLTGGAGVDLFVFGSALKGSDDRIAGFTSVDDTIYLDDKIFGRFAKGFVDPSHFLASTKVDASGAAKSGQWLLYDTDSGRLYYDDDGSGAHAKVLVATFGGDPVLVAADLKVI